MADQAVLPISLAPAVGSIFPYDLDEARHALRLAGYAYADVLAREEAFAASWLVSWKLTGDADVPDEDRRLLDLLWRMLRLVDAIGGTYYHDIIDDDRDPTLGDAMALLIDRRVVHPDDLPLFARALRNAGFDRMAAAVAKAVQA